MKTKWECKGKHRYNSKDEAMLDIYIMISESYGGYTFIRPYKCKFCKGWHLTSRD